MMNQISDEAILEGIKLKSQFIVSYLYEELFPGLLKLITANSGSEEDAEDIFQEALIVVYQKMGHPEFELTSSFKSYFYGVSKMLWLRKISDFSISDDAFDINRVIFAPEIAEDDVARELQVDEDILKHGLYQKYFLQLGAECQEILKLAMKKVSIKEISEKTGLTPNYVKSRKSTCRKKLIDYIKKDPQYKNYLEYEK
ncbi:MAG: RNA polymerase sigma factor [Bacteroidota bacterium]